MLWPAARSRTLGLLLADPDEELHLREIARRAGMAPAGIQREVTALAEAGVLQRRRVGHQVYYSANPQCPIFPELRSLVLKTTGLGDALRQALQPLEARIKVAFVFGSIAEGTAGNDSDVDLLVVGEVGLREVAPGLQEAQQALGREVNAVTMRPRELRRRVEAGDHFVTSVLRGPKWFLMGGPDELERLAAGRAASPA